MPEEVKKKKVKHRLPKRIIAIKNRDKTWHEKHYPGRDLLNIPHPFRALMLGKPNSGKSTIILNLLLRAKPVFERIAVVHYDGESKEYTDLDVEMLDGIPHVSEIDPTIKQLVILEDIDLAGLSKEQKSNLDRLYGYVSTHCNVSVVLTSQDVFRVPTIVRRCSNLFVIWRCTDLDALACIGRRVGIKSKTFIALFDKFIETSKDSIWVDMTDGTPANLRKNGYEVISKVIDDKKNSDITEV
jgi:hypothetical protein